MSELISKIDINTDSMSVHTISIYIYFTCPCQYKGLKPVNNQY